MPRSRSHPLALAALLASLAAPTLVSQAAPPPSRGLPVLVGAERPSDPLRRRLDSRLVALASEHAAFRRGAGDGAAVFSPSTRGVEVGGGLVTLDLVAENDPFHLLRDLARLGLRDGVVRGRVVSGRLPLGSLAAAASLDSLRFARAALALPPPRVGDAEESGPPPAPVISQGDAAIRADLARTAFGLGGSGVRVGVIADTFDCSGTGVAAGIASGDLPAATAVLDEGPCPGSDRGRAMAEAIHDVAPGASIVFRSGRGGQAAMAAAIAALSGSDGVDVLVTDAGYLEEPMFQDGVIAQAVDSAAALGVVVLPAAGDRGRRAHGEAFRPSGIPVLYDGDAHDFDPGPAVDVYQAITIPLEEEILLTLQWDSPYFSVSGAPGTPNDLDICLMDEPPTTLLACGDSLNLGGDPVETLAFYNDGAWGTQFNLVIELFDGPAPSWMSYVLYAGGDPQEHPAPGATLLGHANAAGAGAVGAAFYFDTPRFGTAPPLLSTTSSVGGVPIFHDLAGARLPLPEVRPQPRFVGADGGNNTFHGADIPDPGDRSDQDHDPNFFGTAAAAAHVAGAAALLRQRQGALTPAGLLDALAASADDMDDPATPGFDAGFDHASGSGLVRADLAAASVPRCGDGVPEPPEECDDANAVDDDACGNDCLANVCGDGVRHPANGEACDDGNADDGDFCRNDCQPNYCGDGRVTNTEQDLLTNGDFETGTLQGWEIPSLGSGGLGIAPPGAATPLSRFPTAANPAGGNFYALSDMLDAGTLALAQPFVVPGPANALQIGFEMFVNDQSGVGPIIDPIGLDHTGPPNQHARVDLLAAGAAPFDTGASVLATLYLGVDPGPNPHPYTGYSFDLLGAAPPGGTYTIRFAEVDNQYFLHLGVDNVAIRAALREECDDGNNVDGDGCSGGCAWEVCPAPAEVTGVLLLADGATIQWAPDPAASSWDVVRWASVPPGGGAPGSEVCLAAASPSTTASDATGPAPREVFFYLVRARGPCGPGTWGTTSGGVPRVAGPCS